MARYYNVAERRVEQFNALWMETIEREDYLALDCVIPKVHASLAFLKTLGPLYLCTARQFEERVTTQLYNLEMYSLFDEIIVTGQLKDDKERAIRDRRLKLSRQSWMVGDTGRDIKVAKALNIRSCAVASGVMNIHNLRKYAPDKLVFSIGEFASEIAN